MFGQMMDRPLLISAILRHAETAASQSRDRLGHRGSSASPLHVCARPSRARASSPTRCGGSACSAAIAIATLAWNDFRHFEIYYGVSCSGFVCHTINPRLFEDQIVYIVNHAEDRWLFLDPAFVPLIEKLQSRLPKLEGCVDPDATTRTCRRRSCRARAATSR